MPDGLKSDSSVFTSWKEIASYLGKGVRTVQRWEAQFGLPVQRPSARAKGIVRVTREELDQWLATRWSPRMENSEQAGTFPAPLALVKEVMEAHHDLQQQNRALLMGLRQSLDQLEQNCRTLLLNMTFTHGLQDDGIVESLPDPSINKSRLGPSHSVHQQLKPE